MKITSLNIQGYRSLKDVEWHPGDLNVVIGANGSGKSNLIQALRLFSVSAGGSLSKQLSFEGGIDNVVWNEQANQLRLFCLITSRDFPAFWYHVRLVRRAVNRFFLYETLEPKVESDGSIDNKELFSIASSEEPFATTVFDGTYAASFDTFSRQETVLSMFNTPTPYGESFREIASELSSWLLLDDFRSDRDSPIRRDTVTRFEERLDPDGQNLIAVLHTHYSNRKFKDAINSAMTAAFGDEFEELVFAPSADQRIQLRIRWKSLKNTYSSANLSDGTLRFLFLITALAQPNPPSLIAIDEPETGLHPSMMKIVAEHAADAALRTQVVLTTHSSQFLDALGQHKPTVTVCEMHDGATVLKTITGEELDYWLARYTLGDLQNSGQLESMGDVNSNTSEEEIAA